MKKVFYLIMPIVLIAAMSSCSNNNKTAGESAKKYAEHIKNNDYDGFMEYVHLDDFPAASSTAERNVSPSDLSRMKAQNARALRSNVESYVQQNGGIKNVTVKSENVSSDGKTANVTLQHEYNNGQTEDVTYDLVLVDNDWKVKVGNNREVWSTRFADGRNATITLKENDNENGYRQVLKEHVGDDEIIEKLKESDGRYVEKVKTDAGKEVLKVKDKGDKIVVKEKVNGEKNVTEIEKN